MDCPDPTSSLYRIGHLSATELEGVFYALFNSFKIGTYSFTVGPFSCRPARNEVADDLANVAASNPVDLEDHVVLTSTEIYSRAKDLICRTWVVPPVQPLYFQSHPGSAISFKGSRSYQTAFLLFSTGRLKCMKFEGGKKTFSICTK
ncbi:RNase H domain-containing protein [Trichonephila clavipes]|nr:RNase H domain-containing protein [Trichonephila clavipes]